MTGQIKLDASCGLSAKQIGTIKFKIRRALDAMLPELPEHVEEMRFLQGRDAWTYSWQLLEQDVQNASHPITLQSRRNSNGNFPAIRSVGATSFGAV